MTPISPFVFHLTASWTRILRMIREWTVSTCSVFLIVYSHILYSHHSQPPCYLWLKGACRFGFIHISVILSVCYLHVLKLNIHRYLIRTINVRMTTCYRPAEVYVLLLLPFSLTSLLSILSHLRQFWKCLPLFKGFHFRRCHLEFSGVMHPWYPWYVRFW